MHFYVLPILFLLGACAYIEQEENDYEVDRTINAKLISNGVKYRPHIHSMGGSVMTENGLLSVDGIDFETWLEINADELSVIPYSDYMQVVIEGQNTLIREERNNPQYFGEMRLIQLLPDMFSDGMANVSIPEEHGVYLVYVILTWMHGKEGFTSCFVFKVMK